MSIYFYNSETESKFANGYEFESYCAALIALRMLSMLQPFIESNVE